MEIVDPKRRYSQEKTVNRSCTRYYWLSIECTSSRKIHVCKQIFLRTLGYKSDKVLTTAAASADMHGFDNGDKRGKHELSNKLTGAELEFLVNHIKSFNPCISHYRREHAPNRLYLPPELSAVDMHADYEGECENQNIRCVAYNKYTKVIIIIKYKLRKTR